PPQIVPRANQLKAAFAERRFRKRREQIRIERILHAQPVALWTHPLRTVEAEQLRTRRLKRQPTVRARIVRRKRNVPLARRCPPPFSLFASLFRPFSPSSLFSPFGPWHPGLSPSSRPSTHQPPLPPPTPQPPPLCQPRPHIPLHPQPIDHHLDVVPHLPVER